MTKMKLSEEGIDCIAQINKEIKGALHFWSGMLSRADVEDWAFMLDFDETDIFDTLKIFLSTWSNHCIKNGTLTEENVEEKFSKFREAIKECFGIDTVELVKRYIENALKMNEI